MIVLYLCKKEILVLQTRKLNATKQLISLQDEKYTSKIESSIIESYNAQDVKRDLNSFNQK